MSRDPRYQRLLNDRRWRELRIAYLREHPLCERCIREGKAAGVPEGYITPAIDVHHRVPVETAKTLQEMERLAYDWNNLEALCFTWIHLSLHDFAKNCFSFFLTYAFFSFFACFSVTEGLYFSISSTVMAVSFFSSTR